MFLHTLEIVRQLFSQGICKSRPVIYFEMQGEQYYILSKLDGLLDLVIFVVSSECLRASLACKFTSVGHTSGIPVEHNNVKPQVLLKFVEK